MYSQSLDQKSKKKKKSKKKGTGTNNAPTPTPATPADTDTQEVTESPIDAKEVPEEDDESEQEEVTVATPAPAQQLPVDEPPIAQQPEETPTAQPHATQPPDLTSTITNGVAKATLEDADENENDAAARFDALVADRDALRHEVTELRKSLESLQSKHESEIETLQENLSDAQAEKESAEEQYQNLLGKVNTIRSQLGERLKADAEDLSQARTRIDELEEQKAELQQQYTARAAEVDELTAHNADLNAKTAEQAKELSSLRNRLTLSQQNWLKEKDELIEQEAYLREEFESAKQAMHDWEVLAMEERTLRRDLSDRTSDLEEQLATLREAYEKVSADRDANSQTVDGLQKALQEIQTVRKQELKELVEANQAEQDALRKQVAELQATHESTTTELAETKQQLERALPFEKEVKEKNLLIGKLRHEAVILNDHLTKALRFLKKGKPEDNVDRQIVTNHFLHFLALDRSDPKKFQVLQLIAALLGWNDEQREQAGLARPGGAGSISLTGSLRLPSSPIVHRTPSTPALHHDYFGADSTTSPASRETLAELWQNFLEQEATQTKTGKSRQASQSMNPPSAR
ncbi:hypothetical protein EDD36DRAFT_140142 [Exophiala viscosa]|uniref:GRIP domain-containing protein n=1 Tax=Exophiala viscosa TaxID=2486360 RepID=A0AAN6IGE2_9EURO|nr:hypothetical protein EDD36DRAFT_140142 [Exophiala viscosa]